jgi:sodium transport system permease protein
MRWSIIRLIWLRELRDQLRDRRTLFMIAVLPVLLYPIVGFGVMNLLTGYLHQQSPVGISGADELLPPPLTPQGVVSWLASMPSSDAALGSVSQFAVAVSLNLAQPGLEYPPLIERRGSDLVFRERYHPRGPRGQTLLLREGMDRQALQDRRIDLLLLVPPGFRKDLDRGGKPTLSVITREKDETSHLVNVRVTTVINRWKRDLKEVRLAQQGLPIDFDEVVRIQDPERSRPMAVQEEEGLFSLMVRIFPFILVMWSLAGALYPAVDLCAGEKERGTMETLLISPAAREEIVFGKFLTILVFSAGTALLNLLSMALTTWKFGSAMPGTAFRPMALFWGVVLLLPLSAFFSAVCLAVGAYARSSKEGQYYLMPLFLVTMPLIFLTLVPGVELNPFYSMVPVTGVALLLQKLMAASADRGLWVYFIPVLAPMVIYSWLALRWAVAQFQREEVLFREAERLDLGLWLRRLLRDKEALPSAGEAIFCFVLILALRWVSFGVGGQLSLLVRTGISQLAFVATPPLFMALLMTTRPRLGLALRLPPWWAWIASALLAVCLVPPLVELTAAILRQFPALRTMLELNHPLTRELHHPEAPPLKVFLVLALLPALCEEAAFRGFILTGLLRGFRPWTAILLSAFLFSLYQMNVFQFVPHFLLGIVLGMLAARTGSVLPAMVFHLVYNSLVLAPILLGAEEGASARLSRPALSAGGTILAALGLYVVWRLGRQPAEITPAASPKAPAH